MKKLFLIGKVSAFNTQIIASDFCTFFTIIADLIKAKTIKLSDYVWCQLFVGETRTDKLNKFPR